MLHRLRADEDLSKRALEDLKRQQREKKRAAAAPVLAGKPRIPLNIHVEPKVLEKIAPQAQVVPFEPPPAAVQGVVRSAKTYS